MRKVFAACPAHGGEPSEDLLGDASFAGAASFGGFLSLENGHAMDVQWTLRWTFDGHYDGHSMDIAK